MELMHWKDLKICKSKQKNIHDQNMAEKELAPDLSCVCRPDIA